MGSLSFRCDMGEECIFVHVMKMKVLYLILPYPFSHEMIRTRPCFIHQAK